MTTRKITETKDTDLIQRQSEPVNPEKAIATARSITSGAIKNLLD